jgi:adenosylcobinamide-GDP ribazoletransferase
VNSLILAVRFLTIVPVPGPESPGPLALGRAAWWFPVVGFALGGGLVGAARLIETTLPSLVGAALLVTLWKLATGAIHLDGLADSLDGLAGRDPATRLAIMRDGRVGVFGATGLVLILILSVSAVAALMGPARSRLLVLAPVIGRTAPLLAGAWLAPATPGRGLGAAFAAGLSRWCGPVHVVTASALGAWLLGAWGVAVVLASCGTATVAVGLAARRLGGVSGDLLGAAIELTELAVLLAGAAAVQGGLF